MKKKMSILAALVLAVVVTGYSVSGTYAKYTSTFTGSDSARVAKWSFNIGGSAANMITNEFTFDLFNTINDANVATGTDETIIAPGTTGSFDIVLQNKSEVTAKYYVVLSETANAGNIPVEYSTNGTDWKSLADINTELKNAEAELAMNAGSDTTKTIKWRWAFEKANSETDTDTDVRDTADTKLGVDANTTDQTITVKAEIVVTQVD